MDGLLTMATQSTDDVLALVLESLRIVMSVSWLAPAGFGDFLLCESFAFAAECHSLSMDLSNFQVNKEFTTSYEGRITPLTIALFIKYAHGKRITILINKLTIISELIDMESDF